MIYANILLKEYSKSDIAKIAKLAEEFCSKKLGKCRNKKFPKLVLSYRNQKEFMGVYDPRKHILTIYIKRCLTVSDLTKTIIHEWTHSKQRVLTDYGRLYNKYGYEKNPMEIEAYAAENIWNRKMLNYIRKNFPFSPL
jgi:hypothetical protein